MESFFKSNYSDFINTFDDICGYDVASIQLNEVTFYGQLTKSPLQERIMTELNYIPVLEEIKKPFKAHWMVYESKLLLGYINGIFNEKRFYTTDVVPEFPDNELLFHYTKYSGILTFIICEIEISDITFLGINNFDILKLEFENGVLLGLEKQMKTIN